MQKLILFFKLYPCLILSAIQCSTIEFIPDNDYRLDSSNYSKKRFEEIEIHTSKPKKPIRILGTIIIRNFEGKISIENYRNSLQKELFDLKVDGVWLTLGKIEEVEPMIVRTENREGLPVAYYESNKQMAKITGLVFRYKKENGTRKN